jgi:hypothetical protein
MDLPRRRVLTGAALLVVAAVVVIGVAHSVAGPRPYPLPLRQRPRPSWRPPCTATSAWGLSCS